MAVKLLMTWDILPGREQEYFEFVVREFLPGVQKLGLEPSDAWFTMYGDHPQIMASVQGATVASVQRVLESSEWESLTRQLLDYVEEFKYKIVNARPGFQM
ncbi:MAG: hypothetical protein PHS96_00720 [Anaerolineales bacterium]|nr:hypothetical protein [Anaerolineales bacterium]MDD5466307.1 hypothetical protein [Anaerolineales bacterium]